MSSSQRETGGQSWSCVACGAPQLLAAGRRYHRCEACGALFKLTWRGGRLDGQAIRRLPIDIIDAQLPTELLQERVQGARLQLRRFSDRIRGLEMAKSSERLALLAVFVIICAAIYAAFHMTVLGDSGLARLGQTGIAVAAVAGVAAAVLALLRLRRGAVVRRVRRLYRQREEAERELESGEAALALRGLGPADEGAESSGAGEADILEKYAATQRQRRGRLSLRRQT